MIEALLFVAHVFLFLKNFIWKIFIFIIYKPLRFVFSFLFHKVIVKLYGKYFTFIKKVGWDKAKGGILRFIFNQKFVHVLVACLTVVVVFGNFANKTKAGIYSTSQNTILADLIQSEFSDVETEELVEEFYDIDSAGKISNPRYLNDNLSAVHNILASQLLDGDETDSENLGVITQGGSALIKPEIASTQISVKARENIIDYTVEPGDTVSTIAQKFGISVNTVLWENNLSSYSLIRPGQVLRILPFTGIAHTISRGETLGSIANKYDADSEKIMEVNKMDNANQLAVGQKLLIPGGSKTTYTPSASTSYTGVSAIRDIVKAPSATPATGNYMNWPTEGHRITQYYSWRHLGLDIANKTGTPIYASDAGIVESAGWGNGYGYNIVIDHGGGKKTRYAHLSKFYVSAGDAVSKGGSIGEMGSTGWSTGPHLHFEVIIGGAKQNPLNYIR